MRVGVMGLGLALACGGCGPGDPRVDPPGGYGPVTPNWGLLPVYDSDDAGVDSQPSCWPVWDDSGVSHGGVSCRDICSGWDGGTECLELRCHDNVGRWGGHVLRCVAQRGG